MIVDNKMDPATERDLLFQENATLKAENARLAAALRNATNIGERWAQQGDWDADTARGVAAEIAEQANGSTALNGLLGLTVELEMRATDIAKGHLATCQCEKCLFARALSEDAARLRAAMEAKP